MKIYKNPKKRDPSGAKAPEGKTDAIASESRTQKADYRFTKAARKPRIEPLVAGGLCRVSANTPALDWAFQKPPRKGSRSP